MVKQKKFGLFIMTFALMFSYGFINKASIKKSEKYEVHNSKSEQIRKLLTKNKLWGTVVFNNKLGKIQTISVGYANYAKRKLNSSSTLYPLASLEKGYTAVIIQKLIDRHLLTMDTKLSEYYPKVRYARKITIRELLDHTSGIEMGEPIPNKVLVSDSSIVDWTLKNLKSTGKMTWDYSNANYVLLAGIITKITKEPYSKVLNTTILKPLGLTDTNEYIGQQEKQAAISYYAQNKIEEHPISYKLISSELGCGNLYTSPTEYFKFVTALENGNLLSQESFAQLSRNRGGLYSGGFYYFKNGQRAQGADNGYYTFYYGDRKHNVNIVFMMNKGGSDSQGVKIIDQISSILQKKDSF